ncbi:chitinase-3-like protein 1 isoform X2 [Phlebotomus argentipes]|uniref:chitinase-3-like protein 1 isoform X2 n=1 Tax=Phlebotomus argentipes TaxID=94469 RepID=UPI0028932848|nr:chitinase-3-like protein 1 isoform X2 [Phlebotomus argentipes]
MRILLLSAIVVAFVSFSGAQQKIVCYHGTWSYYRQGNGKFGVAQIDPFLCTHLVYAFFGIAPEGAIRILDPWLDLEDNYGLGNIKKFNELKKLNPKLKTIAAVGGWNEGSTTFSQVANSEAKRKRFAKSAVEFLEKFHFDGLDMDWEYPGQRGGNPSTDKKAFTLFLKDLSEALHAKGFILSAATASAEFSAEISYDIAEVGKYLDYIGIMTYDLHGSWDQKIGNNAPLYAGSWDETARERQLNVDAAISYWLQSGAPREKILLGVPSYGRGFRMINGQSAPGSPHAGPSDPGPHTRTPGMLGFNELCETRQSQKWEDHWDEQQFVPYVTKGSQWIGYDDEKSLRFKANYVQSHNLGGMMMWSIETDDFKGFCGRGAFPLLKEINSALLGTNFPPVETTPVPSVTTQKPQECLQDGFSRDPDQCNVFYICEGGNIYQFICPEGLVFDTVNNICNWPSLVDCSLKRE